MPIELDKTMLVSEPWNSENFVPKQLFLQHEQTVEDRERLHTMGNIVIPQQAYAAVACLSVMKAKACE